MPEGHWLILLYRETKELEQIASVWNAEKRK